MPRFSRSRLIIPTLLLLSPAAIGAKGDDSVPAALPVVIDAEPLSESGVRLARLLEEDVEEVEVPRAPDDMDRLTRLDLGQPLSLGATKINVDGDFAAPFTLLQAALLTLCAGGATGGVWFVVSRLPGDRPARLAPIAMQHVPSIEADVLARVIVGNIRVTDEALEDLNLTRLFGSALASTRYRVDDAPSQESAQAVREVAMADGAFHRVSEAAVAVEPPHFNSRQPAGSPAERQAAPGGVSS